MINAWIKSGRCIGVSNLRRGFKLPRWQVELVIWPALQPMAKSLGTADGWQLRVSGVALHSTGRLDTARRLSAFWHWQWPRLIDLIHEFQRT